MVNWRNDASIATFNEREGLWSVDTSVATFNERKGLGNRLGVSPPKKTIIVTLFMMNKSFL